MGAGLLLLGKRSLVAYDKDKSDPFEDEWDLTMAEDSLASHQSVKEGGLLTGIFANNVKVLAILAKSAKDRLNQIHPDRVINWTVNGVTTPLNHIRDMALDNLSSTRQTLDSLVNLAIDNVKDQALNKFRINSKNMGQFERTIIVVDEGSEIHYMEGCTAPTYTSDALHAAVVEIYVKKNAKCRYTTIQNWSSDVYNLVTKRAIVEESGLS